MPGFNIIVHEDGNAEVKTEGYQGEACAADIERLFAEMEAAGVKIVRKDAKKIPQNTTSAHRSSVRA